MKRELRLSCVLVVIVCIAFACRPQPTQKDLEYETAVTIRKLLALHEAQFPETPVTNVAQAFSLMDPTHPQQMHPHYLQQRFRSFGRYSGFENSIYEKYVVLPMAHRPRTRYGEIAFLNSKAFPGTDGKLGRIVASIIGNGYKDCRVDWFGESQIEQMFKEAGMQIPKPIPMPPPPALPPLEPDPFTVKVERYFRDVAGDIGIGRGSWWIILFLYAGVASLLLVFLFIWVGRRRQH